MRTASGLIVAAALAIAGAHDAASASPAPKPSPSATPSPTRSARSKLTGRDLDIAALRQLLPRFEEDMLIAEVARIERQEIMKQKIWFNNW